MKEYQNNGSCYVWRYGKYKSSYIGIMCNEIVNEVSNTSTTDNSSDVKLEIRSDDGSHSNETIKYVAMSTLICNKSTNFWVSKCRFITLHLPSLIL